MVTDWDKVSFDTDLIPVQGYVPYTIKPGQTLLGEFVKSYMLFEFVEVKYMSDPTDQFFGKVKAIQQEMK